MSQPAFPKLFEAADAGFFPSPARASVPLDFFPSGSLKKHSPERFMKNFQHQNFHTSTASWPDALRLQPPRLVKHPGLKNRTEIGFTVYSSIPGMGDKKGEIPFPRPGDRVEGGHAVVAVGYDDSRKIGKETGAVLIRNSWGTGWGDNGYGWLPYAFITSGLAVDFWALVQSEFVDTELFE